MKLQISRQTLRVRIGEDELAQLLDGQTVQARTQFAQAFAIGFALRLTSHDHAGLSGRSDDWQLALPMRPVAELASRLPAREGLRFELAGKTEADALELLFEVDVRDSAKRRRVGPRADIAPLSER